MMKALVAGLGSIGRRHLKNLVSLGVDEIRLLRSHKSTIDDDELRDFSVFTNIEKAVSWNPGAVVISNPTSLHVETAIPFAESGSSLLIEKPLGSSLEGTENLLDIQKKSNSKILMGFQFRFHPGLLQIYKWLKEKKIGRIISAKSHWGEYLPKWHPWEDYRNSYSAKKELGGGVLLTLCHPIDYFRWLLGEVSAVSADVRKISDLEINVEDYAQFNMFHENGVISSVHLNYFQYPKQHDLEIIGSNGVIYWDYKDGTKIFLHNEEKWKIADLPRNFERNHLFIDEMIHFIDVHRGLQEPICTLADGIRIQKIISAIYNSSIMKNKVIYLK